MRYWIMVACAFTAVALRGQGTILPLLYYTPPTSGCNGVAAFLDSTSNCFQGIYTISPMGCVNGINISGDTAFFSICSVPCEVVYLDGWGLPCICGLGFPTSLLERREASLLTLSRMDDDLVITAPHTLSDPWCRIYGSSGRVLVQERLPSGTKWRIDVAGLEQFLIVELRTAEHALVGRP